MRIIQTKAYSQMSQRAAGLLAAQVILKPDSVLGLATGSSPLGTYDELIRLYNEGLVDFSQISTFNLDEYCGLAPENDQSYYYFMRTNLFDKIGLRKEQSHIPSGITVDAQGECAAYEEKIKKSGGIDIQLLGLGLNGHIGFNEPADSFAAETHCVDLTESTIEANKRFFPSADDVPRQAYTMGIGTIMRARKIVLIVSGAQKAGILRDALFGPVTPYVPASVLQLHPDVCVVADEEALSLCEIR